MKKTMNGYSSYSKIKVVGNEQEISSRSMDTPSDLNSSLSESHTSKPTSDPIPSPDPDINSDPKSGTQDSSKQEIGDIKEGNNNTNNKEMMFGPKLKRNSSVSSAYALQTAVKGAFSMKRSSSVSERYCRIHDQSVTLASPFDEEEEEDELDITANTRRSMKKKNNNKGKILKAWKKLFGL